MKIRSDSCRPGQAAAFTLVEVIVAMTILIFAVAGAAAITMQGLKIYAYDSDRLMLNNDMRHFTEQLSADAAGANCFLVYDSLATMNARSTTGVSGDYLVLVTLTPDASTGWSDITKIVGYYRVQTNATTNVGTVYRYSKTFSTPVAWTTTTASTWLASQVPTTTPTNTYPIFAQSVIGTGYDGTNYKKLFYINNSTNTSIMVKGKVQDQYNANYKLAIDTYNLTIAPHG
ncbi:MAG TPA: hypothetical protein VFB27_10325 [Opitutaceae bacterium]|nr:hypothetical protein [Opitutaceae bacterium]